MNENGVLTEEQKNKINAKIKEILPLIEGSLETCKSKVPVEGKTLTLGLLSLALDICTNKIKRIIDKKEE